MIGLTPQEPGGHDHGILHLVYSGQRRGAETFAVQLARNLSPTKFRQAFCSVYDFPDRLPGGDFPLFTLSAERNGLGKALRFDAQALLRLIRLVRDYRPHLILAHGADTLKYAAMAKPFLPSVRVVYRNIGFASHWAGSPMKARLMGFLLRYMDAVIVLGEKSCVDFSGTYRFPQSRIIKVLNAVDVQPFREMDLPLTRRQMRQHLGLGDAPAIIFVGSLSEEKNPQELLQVLARLLGHGIECRLLVVGDGPLRLQLEREAFERGISDQVRFLGSRDDVPFLLAAADLLLLPSRTESMPAVLIEAGLAGLPSVAYGVGDIDEVIEPNVTGLIVQPENKAEFEGAVITALRDPAWRATMGEAARQLYSQRFDIRTIAAEYEEVFARLLGNGDRSPIGTHNRLKRS